MTRNKGYKSVPLSFNRVAVSASANVTRDRNVIHSITEVDITEPRRRMKDHFERTGEKLSMTAYIVTCLGRTIKQFPEFNSFIKGRRLIVLEDVVVNVLIERELEGERVPEPIGLRGTHEKSFYDIHREIREAKSRQGERLGSLSGKTWVRLIPRFLMTTFIRLADKNIAMAKTYGKVSVTAVGMFSKEALWFVPHGSATVLITVGSICHKVVETGEGFTSREHLCLTVSFDHDIVDGAPAARFMSRLIQTIKSGNLIEVD